MTYTFPSTIKAARISTFISTAAWIQGSVAVPVGDVWLPEDALNNFLQRNTVRRRQDNTTNPSPTPVPGVVVLPGAGEDKGKDDGEEEGDDAESVDSSVGGAESVDSSNSSNSGGGSTKNGEKEVAGTPVSSSPVQEGSSIGGGPQKEGLGDGSTGQRAAPGLTPGGQAAIAVWVVIAVVAAGVAFWWFRRRRRNKKLGSDTSSIRDSEAARSQPMAAQGALPSILPPMDPAFIPRSGSRQSGADYVMRAQPPAGNGDGIPFGADSQSWRHSPPPGAYGTVGVGGALGSPELQRSNSKVGLPSNPRPGSQQREMVIGSPIMNGPSYRRDQDARTVVTDGTESTIFNWR